MRYYRHIHYIHLQYEVLAELEGDRSGEEADGVEHQLYYYPVQIQQPVAVAIAPVHRGGPFTVESQSLGTVNPLPVCCRSICVGLKYRWRRGKGITGTPLAPLSVSVDFVLVALRNSLSDTNDYADPHTFSQSHPLSISIYIYSLIYGLLI
ncbi:GSCOCG00003810001-RA-CDS, partial [Cotesia congregata]